MAFKGLSQDQTAACDKVGNITQTFWVICCSEKESLSVICLCLWLFHSFSVYLFWSLKYLSTLQIMEKMKRVLWDIFHGNLCWTLSEILAVTVSKVLRWRQWILGQGFSDSDFNIYVLHKFHWNGIHRLTQGGHRLFLFQGTNTKVWEGYCTAKLCLVRGEPSTMQNLQ